jgi:hypothetical protein
MKLRTAATLLLSIAASSVAIIAQPADSETRHHGYEHGYRDGFAYGQDARSRGASLDTNGDAYRNADHGYRAEFGLKEEYETGYREGYRVGADDGFANRIERLEKMFATDSEAPPNDRWGGYDVAAELGYRDGVKSGIKDSRDRHSFRPTEHDQWKDGDRGYHDSLGSKEAYKASYRKAYESGYRDGYGPPRG